MYSKWSHPHNTFTLFIWSGGWANSITGQKMSVSLSASLPDCVSVCQSVCLPGWHNYNRYFSGISCTPAFFWYISGVYFIQSNSLPREFHPHTNCWLYIGIYVYFVILMFIIMHAGMFYIYNVSQKTRHPIVTIILSNLNRSSKFFHCWKVF